MYKKILKDFGVSSFFWRYFVVLIVILLIPFLTVSFFAATNASRTIEENMLVQSKNVVNSKMMELDKIFASIEEFHSEFCLDTSTDLFFSGKKENSIEYSKLISDLSKELNGFMISAQVLDSIYVFNLTTDFILSTTRTTNAAPEDFADFSWYKQYKENATSVFSRKVTINRNNYEFLTYCKSVYYNDQEEGIIVYNIDMDALREVLSSENIDMYLLSKDGSLLCTSVKNDDAPPESIQAAYQAFDENKKKQNNSLTISEDVTGAYSKDLGFYMLAKNNGIKLQSRKQYYFTLICLGMGLILLAFLTAMAFTVKVYSAIIKIIIAIQHPLDYSVSSQSRRNKKEDEISFITNQFLDIKNKNSDIEKELLTGMHKLKEAQNIALQAQLTPHFLFNTLQLISYVEIERNGGDTDLVNIVTNLSEMLRFALDSTKYFVSLETEIKFIEKYLEIQRYKYRNKFDVHWDINPDTLNKKCIKLILQPIFENAIFHGISPVSGRGNIYVSAKIDDALIIKVKNDGHVIAEKKCEEINNSLKMQDIAKNKNFGLSNVNRRIQLIFGEEYGCKIGIENGLTSVVLRMPVFDANEREETDV